MSIVVGIAGAVGHDAAACVFVDGKLVAAAEEERFLRDKHAKGKLPEEALKWCLRHSGLKPENVDAVAIAFAPISLFSKARWHYAKRYWYAPDRAFDALLNGNRRYRRHKRHVVSMLRKLGFASNVILKPVEHHLAHASSAYHLSGFEEKTAILGIDGKGEYATTFFGVGENGKIKKIKEFYDPDSLGGLYGALTQYLGFEMLDGEFKVMGMAPYGNPNKYNLSDLIKYNDKYFHINTKLVNTVGLRRYKKNGKGYYFSKKLINWLGEKREGDEIDEPYIHYAASIQQLLEKVTDKLVTTYLGDILKETGKLCFAGGVALNVKLNQKLLARKDINELFIQPAANDAGTAIGAASYVANEMGDKVKPMEHVYLGPEYTQEECLAALAGYEGKFNWKQVDNCAKAGAKVLADGHPLAWFQGRMEFGPRALGNRSILGDPSVPGIADKINAQIKYRERWRPFCPSMLACVAKDILQTEHPAPYMTLTFDVAKKWFDKIPEVVHEDGTARAQVVDEKANPQYHALITELNQIRNIPVVLNTSLNRRGEPMVCSPQDALNMFAGCDLQYLMLGNILVEKSV